MIARNLGPSDLDDLHAIASHWSVVGQLGSWPWPPDRDFTASRCKPYGGRGFVWGLEQADRLIGTVAVTQGELGYMLHPAVQGHGLGTYWTQQAVDHAFITPDLAQIDASVWADNVASARLLLKIGFVHWQTIYVTSLARGCPAPCHFYRLPRPAWDRLRNRAG